MNHELKDKVVVITGAANGIGACIAQTFINLGAYIIFCDQDKKAGDKREKILNGSTKDKRAFFYKVDLQAPSEIKKFTASILKKHRKVDLLINNAGFLTKKKFPERPLNEWDETLNVNLRSYYLCAQLLLPGLRKARGNIINIASTRALMSEANTEPYAASKGGIVALTHALAISLSDDQIRVNCISPGWIETSAWHMPPQEKKLRAIDHAQHPVGRVGKPEDIAQACVFLASDEKAGFITGQNLIVDGGMTKKMIYVS